MKPYLQIYTLHFQLCRLNLSPMKLYFIFTLLNIQSMQRLALIEGQLPLLIDCRVAGWMSKSRGDYNFMQTYPSPPQL